MKVRQFTHGDLDGAAAAVVARYIFPVDDIEVTACQYGDGPDSIDANVSRFLKSVGSGEEKADLLLITDICPSEAVCEGIEILKDKFDKVKVQDHHGTTAWAAKYDWMEHDAGNERCGAQMLLDWGPASDNFIQSFVSAVDAYDRWKLDSQHRERGERLNMLYKFLGFHPFLKEFTDNFTADTDSWLANLMGTLENRLKGTIHAVIKNQMEGAVHVDKHKRRYAFLTLMAPHASEIGHAVLDQFPEVDYVVMAMPGIDAVSMRARDGGVDVSEIAKANGGGGHAAAAGFPYRLGEIVWNAVAGALE